MDWEKIALEGAILLALEIILWGAKWHFFGAGAPMTDCPQGKGSVSFFFSSIRAGRGHPCPECSDRKCEGLPRRV